MATSGSVSTNTYKTSSFYCNWQRESYNIAGNYSVINWQAGLKITGYDEWYSNAIRIDSLWINGTKVVDSLTTGNKYGAGTYQMASGKATIYHNADGTKSFPIAINGWLYSNHTVSSGDVSQTLDTIPRYTELIDNYVMWASDTKVKVHWEATNNCDAVSYSLNNGEWISASGYPSYIVSGLQPNTTYTIKTAVRRTDSQLWTYGTNKTFTTKKTPTLTVNKRDETSISYSWNDVGAVDSSQYSINGGAWTTLPSDKIISGLTAGTEYSFRLRLRYTDSQEYTISNTVVQSTYNYPYINSAPNFIIGQRLTIGIHNPLGRSCEVYIKIGSNSKGGDTTTGDSVLGYDNQEWQNFFYQNIPNSKTGTYQVRLVCSALSRDTTVNGGIFSIPEAINFPDIVSAIEDTDTTCLALTGSNSVFIRYKSKPKITWSGTAKNYASITEIGINNVAKTSPWTDTVWQDGYTSYVQDSRGLRTRFTHNPTNMTIIDYIPLTINFNAFRPLPTTGQIKVEYNGNFYNGDFRTGVANTLVGVYNYREVGTENWITGGSLSFTPTTGENKFTGVANLTGYDYTKAFEFQFIINDGNGVNVLSTNIQTTIVPRGIPIVDWGQNDFRVNGDLNVTGNINGREGINQDIISGNISRHSQSATNWGDTKLTGITEKYAKGEGLTITNDEIVIGEGIEHIMASISIATKPTTVADLSFQIWKNNQSVHEIYNSFDTNMYWRELSITPVLIPVTEGDKISFHFTGGGPNTWEFLQNSVFTIQRV